jgi:hypothetical protein
MAGMAWRFLKRLKGRPSPEAEAARAPARAIAISVSVALDAEGFDPFLYDWPEWGLEEAGEPEPSPPEAGYAAGHPGFDWASPGC